MFFSMVKLKFDFKKVFVFVLKYVVPLILGWIEGDTKMIYEIVSNLLIY